MDQFNIDSFLSESLSNSLDNGADITKVTSDDIKNAEVIQEKLLKFDWLPSIPTLMKKGTTISLRDEEGD